MGCEVSDRSSLFYQWNVIDNATPTSPSNYYKTVNFQLSKDFAGKWNLISIFKASRMRMPIPTLGAKNGMNA